MSYYFAKTLTLPLSEAIERIKAVLAKHGFGVVSEIDMQTTMKKKLDKDMGGYMILGACHPLFAWEALQKEPDIGLMLPCNVIVREVPEGTTVATVDPIASMQAVENSSLADTARRVQDLMRKVIEEA